MNAAALVVVLIILLFVFGGGGWYVRRPGYVGPGAGFGELLWVLAALVLVLVVLRVFGVV